MKTEQQTLNRLEQLVTEVEELSSSIPADQLESNTMLVEQQKQCAFLVGALFTLSWVLDCEEEMKSVVRAMQLQAIADKFGGEG